MSEEKAKKTEDVTVVAPVVETVIVEAVAETVVEANAAETKDF